MPNLLAGARAAGSGPTVPDLLAGAQVGNLLGCSAMGEEGVGGGGGGVTVRLALAAAAALAAQAVVVQLGPAVATGHVPLDAWGW